MPVATRPFINEDILTKFIDQTVSDARIQESISLLSDLVLVRMEPQEHIEHGIWHPENAVRDNAVVFTGTVVAAGPGWRDKFGNLHPLDVKPGDRILYPWIGAEPSKGNFHGSTRWPDENHIVMRESDIRGVIE